MSALTSFLHNLFWNGKVVLSAAPREDSTVESEARIELQRAFETHTLGLTGPAVKFDVELALAASRVVWWSCWLLHDRSLTVKEMADKLRMPLAPQTAGDHILGDLLFQYLPNVLHRAEAISPDEPLAVKLAKVLREWPLSGVLATIVEKPVVSLHFDDHPGLLWLYAERWVRFRKRAWLPTDQGLEYIKMVWKDLGRETEELEQLAKRHEGNAEDT
ncbi:MAG: hypothetical protein ACFCD0_13725 [Gemmataceae bacterium]